jgi:23S rRNA (uracil1939-C5)-methyltransferase
MAEKKGVIFARSKTLSVASIKRILPACRHFESCPSCHFQHITYEDELNFKKESFEKLFRKLPIPNVQVNGAPERFHYRNRIQLHYSIKTQLIGMRDPQTFNITPIPECIIVPIEIKNELKRIYENQEWLKEVPPGNPEGHLEIYWLKGELKRSWNRPYADGGFTQVYEIMNQHLKNQLEKDWKIDSNGGLLDLFGGNGNLSEKLSYSSRLCVDIYKENRGEEFLNQDLYEKDALKRVLHRIHQKNLSPNYLLLDPPRSGFKELPIWLEALRPQKVAYVSCDPHTMARDLQEVKGYSFTHASIFDFFPSTFHFESLIFLDRIT